MKGVAGFRQCTVRPNSLGDTLGAQYVYLEVSNDGATDVLFYINDFTAQGHPPDGGIPIKAGTTREIPMLAYNFTASGPVTVVAYGQ